MQCRQGLLLTDYEDRALDQWLGLGDDDWALNRGKLGDVANLHFRLSP